MGSIVVAQKINSTVAELIARSNQLGSDPKNTNFAGGNTSAKGTAMDPATGQKIDLLWVKGSGGDLGTLTENGLAVLQLERVRALVNVYPGVEREDEMVAAFDYCLHGRGGAAPSIDTAMHALVEANHVDHLHPDSGIAIATAKNGEALTKKIFGDRVLWVDWRRPGFQLGLDIAEIRARTRKPSVVSWVVTESRLGVTPVRNLRPIRLKSLPPRKSSLQRTGKPNHLERLKRHSLPSSQRPALSVRLSWHQSSEDWHPQTSRWLVTSLTTQQFWNF
jgi:hypothetical protein